MNDVINCSSNIPMLSIYHNLLFRIRSNQYLIPRQNKHQMFKFIERMVCLKHGSICNLIWTSCMKNNIRFRIRCRHISRVEFSLAIAMAKSSRLCDIEYSVVLSKKRILTIRPPLWYNDWKTEYLLGNQFALGYINHFENDIHHRNVYALYLFILEIINLTGSKLQLFTISMNGNDSK